MKELHLTIVSPEQELFNGMVTRVTLPGANGSFSIFPQHAPIVSSLMSGEVTYLTSDGTEQAVQVRGGFIELSFNDVVVCVD